MLLKPWLRLSGKPFGKMIFNWMIKKKVPYTGTISPEILEMSAGFVRARMRDRPIVRNHLNSIHAVALMNLGEMSSGLAVTSGIPDRTRPIITRLEIDYLKKARGDLVSTSTFKPGTTDFSQNRTFEVVAEIQNSKLETVARVKAFWLVGPQ